MNNHPSGNITFLFTDIEGSTKLAQDYPETLQSALAIHHSIMRKAIESNNGFVFEIIGDAFCSAFEKAEDAVKAAVDAQINLASEKWKEAVIKVRIGIHTGAAEWNGNGYMGYITLARSARVMSCGNGEQIIISGSTYELCKDKFDSVKDKSISFRDLGERRMKDVIQPIRLYQIISHGLREDFQPLKTLDARPNNLPVQLTSFIGREAEMKEVRKLLSKTRLLTILGFGGGGKTRLAMHTGAEMIDEFSNGVWVTELAQVTDPAFIHLAILNSLGVKEEQGRSAEETLLNYLRDKELLLILDNCEHLISDSAVLVELLLVSCPKLKVITTSREALNCSGEQTFSLPSLSCPDISADNTPEKLSQYESVRLFIERALSVNNNFRVTNDNAPALAEICSRLDGIPLAIELAAARTKVLSVDKIYARLDDRFNLLSGGKRTAMPRQQTLKALIDWSYDLLSEKERILWSRLSVFNGGWTMETAEEICSDEQITAGEILDLLSQLTEKSIIFYDNENERYRILETIKQYGISKLTEAGAEDAIYSKHFDYFKTLSNYDISLSGPDLQDRLNILETEHNNLISAIEWSVKKREMEKAALLAIGLYNFWNLRGHYSAANRILESLIENADGISNNSKALLYQNAGQMNKALGNYKKAKRYFDLSLGLFRELNNKKNISICLHGLANLEAVIGNYEQAKILFTETLGISRETGHLSGIAFALNNLGNIELIRENFEKAEILLKESLEYHRKSGDLHNVSYSLDSLGNLMTDIGNFEQANDYLEECLAISRSFGDKSGIAFALNNLGSIAIKSGETEKARIYYEESLIIRRMLDDKNGIAYTLNNLGNMAFYQAEYDHAQNFLIESLKLRLELEDKYGIMFSLMSLCLLLKNNDRQIDIARILGAVESGFASIGLTVRSKGFELHDQLTKEVRELLSEDEFILNYEEGKKLSYEDAAKLVLSVLSK